MKQCVKCVFYMVRIDTVICEADIISYPIACDRYSKSPKVTTTAGGRYARSIRLLPSPDGSFPYSAKNTIVGDGMYVGSVLWLKSTH